MSANNKKLWMGLDDHNLTTGEIDVAIIGIPYDGAVTRKDGAREAPNLLRKLSKDFSKITEDGINLDGLRIRDFGDIPINHKLHPDQAHDIISKSLSDLFVDNCILLTLGGDHSITCGVVEKLFSKKELGIIWIDSHPDLMDNSGGVKFNGSSRYSHACSLRRIIELPLVDMSNVLILGLRNQFPEEQEYISKNHIEFKSSCDLDVISHQVLSNLVFQKFKNVDSIYISFDIDVLDPSCAPGTGVPVAGGISSRYILNFIKSLCSIYKQNRHFFPLIGFDIVEISPRLDVNDITSMAGMKILIEMFGFIKIILEKDH